MQAKKSANASAQIASTLFKPAENNQAFLKAGLLGFEGTGKSHTSWLLAAGLVGLLSGKRDKAPVLYLDSETGSDFFVDLAKEAGIPLMALKTRAFDDVPRAIMEAKRLGGVLIIDSITHFWAELCGAYLEKKKRTRLQFQDWGPIKDAWARDFTTPYVMEPTHIIMAGRAAFEYDYSVDDDGKKQLEKTGTKMKVEGGTGYEPSLLIEMAREPKGDEVTAGSKAGKRKVIGQLWDRVAYVLKDRTRQLDGVRIANPVFADFLPHVQHLNLGGAHVAFDPARTSAARFADDKEKAFARRITDVKIALEEIQGLMVATVPGTTQVEKTAKVDMLFACFNTRSWTAVENMRLEDLIEGFDKLKIECAAYTAKKNEPALAGGR